MWHKNEREGEKEKGDVFICIENEKLSISDANEIEIRHSII